MIIIILLWKAQLFKKSVGARKKPKLIDLIQSIIIQIFLIPSHLFLI
jgi:hypothetical protein